MPAVTGFYHFSPQPPLSGLGVLADHHVCVPLPITRQRGLFCLLVCRGTPFLLWCECLFSPYISWHALSGPAQLYLFGWCVISVGHFPQKSPGNNLKIGLPFSPPPNHALLPLTHNLTVPCIGQVQFGEVWALCVPSFHVCPKICLLLFRSLWSEGLPAQFAVRSLTFHVSCFLISRSPQGLIFIYYWALHFLRPIS